VLWDKKEKRVCARFENALALGFLLRPQTWIAIAVSRQVAIFNGLLILAKMLLEKVQF